MCQENSLTVFLTPGLRKTWGNLDYFGDIQKMNNSLRVELQSSNAAIYYIKHLDRHCIFTTEKKSLL